MARPDRQCPLCLLCDSWRRCWPVLPPAKVIFAGVGVLLLAARDVRASQETLTEIFERIEQFFRRLEMYTEVPPTPEMTDMMVKIMVEVLSILGIATKEIKQGRAKKYLKKLAGKNDMEDALRRLDKLTYEEVRMAIAQNLKATHSVDVRVRVVADRVLDVDDRVASVDNKVEGVDARVAGVDGEVKEINDKVTVVIDDGKEARVVIQQTADVVDQVKRSQLRQDLRRWLSPPDPSTNHNIACSAHHKGTANWFFEGSIFKEWKSADSLLWLHGKPGSGKSILCSTIIKDILSLRDSGLAFVGYFYFDFRDTSKQTRRDLLPSLVIQLSSRSDPCCDIFSRLYLAHDSGAQKPSEDDLIEYLKDMVALPNQPPVYLIMDALDECPDSSGMPSPREQVLDLLRELVKLDLSNLHICVTSRAEIDIQTALEPLLSSQVSLHNQSGQKKDIIDYVTSVVRSDPKMQSWRDEDKCLVIETLSERADGMFRWVFCQLEALRYCFPPSVRHVLQELPETLDETYERMLREINKANRDHAHRLLQCLTVAVRPLRVAELAEVLAIDFEMAAGTGPLKLNTDWRWEDQKQAVLSTCSSLVVIEEEDGNQVVQFSHFSVKEFLTSPRLGVSSAGVSCFHILLEPAHTILARVCIGVLLRLGDSVDEQTPESTFPLAQYAAKHWANHAQFENVSSRLRGVMEILFDPDQPYFSAWIRVHDIDVEPTPNANFWYFALLDKASASPLYYASLCGFYDLAEHLINNRSQQINAKGGYYVSPLVAALEVKDFKTAQLLYEHGAGVNVEGYYKRTPLYGASCSGHLEIVEWLLRHRASPTRSDQVNGQTPLHEAADNGRLELLRMLLQHKANPNIQDLGGKTPLHVASRYEQPDIVRMLLEYGADVNARDKECATPLHVASMYGILGIARLLVEHGANVGAEDDKGRTPFQVAMRSDMVDLLSDRGFK